MTGLSEKGNKDEDIPEFYNRALEAVRQSSFFTDEAQEFESYPGLENIVFRNGGRTIIKIGKMVQIDRQQAYFYNIERITLDQGAHESVHFKVRYGKYEPDSNSILINAIDRDNSRISQKPEIIAGKLESPDDAVIKLEPELDDFSYLGQMNRTIGNLTIFELFRLSSVLSQFGYVREPVLIEILDRITKPFTFLIVSFFSVGLGWMLRRRKSSFPLFALILTPLIPFILNSILQLYGFGIKLLMGYSLLKTGFTVSLIILLVTQAVILFISLLSVASQRN